MATAVQLRRGTTTQNNAFTGALGEVSVDTTLDTIRVHDGSTQGGFEITSNAAAQTLTNKSLTAPTITGTAVMATLDISGDVDVDGTLETDALTIGGVTLAETISDTVGAMVGSNTETGITVTYQDGDNTLDFALGAAQTTVNSILATDLIIGEDAQTAIDFGTADEIDFKVANAVRLTMTAGAIIPTTDNQIDLGTSSLEFKDAYFDGTVTSDAFAGPLTGNVTGNASGTAATVTGAAQSAITSLGTLTALTVDNLGVNGNTITANSGALNLTPASGSAIVLDGTINVDAGVVTGATSITSTAFVGNVTGNASGTAATVTGAAQSAITSLGTLTALTVDNLGVNGNTITANSGALNLTPASGSAIVLDGTINVDAGVVTGATSITSTAFVGGLTGNVTGNASGTALTVTQAAQTAITSVGTLTTLTVDNVIINGSTIGHTGDTDLITVASGIVTVAGEVSLTTLDIGGTNVTSTAAELNILDDATLTVAELNILDASAGNTALATDVASSSGAGTTNTAKISHTLTLAAELADDATHADIVITNNKVLATSVVLASPSIAVDVLVHTVAAGSFKVSITNKSGGALANDSTMILNYRVI
jgi:hypothetical protein